MKKQIQSAALLLLLLLLLPWTALAAGQVYPIEEIGLSVTVPEGYPVLTRGMSPGDPALVAAELDAAELESYFAEYSIYLDIMAPDYSYEVVVTNLEKDSLSSVQDFRDQEDQALLESAQAFQDLYSAMEVALQDASVYQTGTEKYLKMEILQESEGSTVHGLQFYTIMDRRGYNITLHSYTGAITPEMEAMVTAIVDSAVYSPASSGMTGGQLFLILFISCLIAVLAALVLYYCFRRERVHQVLATLSLRPGGVGKAAGALRTWLTGEKAAPPLEQDPAQAEETASPAPSGQAAPGQESPAREERHDASL